MKYRIFKTFSEDLEYFNINFLPTISIEWFESGQFCLFIGWMVWGLQIKSDGTD